MTQPLKFNTNVLNVQPQTMDPCKIFDIPNMVTKELEDF